MAKINAVWGIDLGQCALKALRCVVEDGQVVAQDVDYIEYPKILSQPESDSDREELIADALEQFLSRNDVKGCKVAISVPGQSGLARFFKPPPVDAKKLPEIVKYEARQQIPFQLDEVIWDYQKLGGGVEYEGMTIDAEVGLFAMKRDQVLRLIKPFQEAGIELDIVQLAPFCVYNYVAKDLLDVDEDEYDPSNPPKSLVVLSMGTDSTDLVITNGVRVWQRSIPLGGNHFTSQLTRELKLTFSKAEHLKRNAKEADDPRAVFQAMRPVFTDLVTEVQRSVGFFQSLDRSAKIGGVIVLGNAVKLPGLQEYLAKNLGYEVVRFQGFTGLGGDTVLSSPQFKDNQLAYGVSYGLCLQGLGVGRLQTNLIPREILLERLVRAKKPWAVATIGSLFLACATHAFLAERQLFKVQESRTDAQGVSWKQAQAESDRVAGLSRTAIGEHETQVGKLKLLTEIGKEVVGSNDRRVMWLEVLRGINEALPTTPGVKAGEIPDVKEVPYEKRREIHLTEVESEYFDNLTTWFTEDVKTIYIENQVSKRRAAELQRLLEESNRRDAAEAAKRRAAAEAAAAGAPAAAPGDPPAAPGDPPAAPGDPPAAAPGDPPAAAGDPAAAASDEPAAGEDDKPALDPTTIQAPTGPGWVIQLRAHHFYNSREDQRLVGDAYVRSTLLKFLEEGKVSLPRRLDDPSVMETFTLKELGIDYAFITGGKLDRRFPMPNPDYVGTQDSGGDTSGTAGAGGFGADGDTGCGDPTAASGGFGFGAPSGGNKKQESDDSVPKHIFVARYDFIVQFVWQEKRLSERLEKIDQQRKEEEEERKKREAEQAGQEPPAGAEGAN